MQYPVFPPDVQFEEDDRVMPLMSAAKIWSKLEKTVADEGVFKNVTILLLVQVIVQIILYVCTQDQRISRHAFKCVLVVE